MKLKPGDTVIYYPPYGNKGLPPEPVKAVVKSVKDDEALIMVKKGTEFIKRRHVSIANLKLA